VNTNTTLSYFWKLPVCVIACLIGLAASSMLLSSYWIFDTIFNPTFRYANTTGLFILAGFILLPFGLAFLSTRLRFAWWTRWIILSELVWMIGILGITIALYFFTGIGLLLSVAIAITTMLIFLLPSVILSGFVAVLFRPNSKSIP